MVALDIDGTLLDTGKPVPEETVAMLDLVRAAGHDVALATGRSLTGVLPVARQLRLTDEYAVTSNGALTARLDPSAPAGYLVEEAHHFDAAPVIRRAATLGPDVRIGVEEVGWGWRVNRLFDDGQVNGDQKQVPLADLYNALATRVVVQAPGVRQHADLLRATGVTVTPAGSDWLDITLLGISKATALEEVRQRLGVPRHRTIAVGDGMNDVLMLEWAGCGVSMGHAPAVVREMADEVTGSISEQGVVPVLHSLVPAAATAAGLPSLGAQLVAAVVTAPGLTVVRVWHGADADLVRCEVWTMGHEEWTRHAPIPGGTGATMHDIEVAAAVAGLSFPLTDLGLRARWTRTPAALDGPDSFTLPITR